MLLLTLSGQSNVAGDMIIGVNIFYVTDQAAQDAELKQSTDNGV